MFSKDLISVDLLSIMALLFITQMAKKSPIVNKRTNNYFINACYITMVILLLEISDKYLQDVYAVDLTWLLKIVNLLGFSLCPLIAYMLSSIYSSDKTKKVKLIIDMPLIIYEIICLSSLFTGLIYDVTPINTYRRGILFPIIPLVNLFYYIRFSYLAISSVPHQEEEDRKFIIAIFIFESLCCILQILIKNLFLIYGGITVSLILYYLLLREIEFRLDPLTKINNRLTYDKYLQKSFIMKNFAIVMFDVNSLKTINDTHGHLSGDKVLYQCATVIKDSFLRMGRVYRIGGDEFCVICKNVTEEDIIEAINGISNILEEINDKIGFKFSISAGYMYKNDGSTSILSEVIDKADVEMYSSKNNYKKNIIEKQI